MKRRLFCKMNGAGNDFIVIEALLKPFDANAEYLRAIADRNTGIGCDQILIIEPPRGDGADFKCRIFNADGSEAEQCGNGVRCLGRYILERDLLGAPSLKLDIPAGVVEVKPDRDHQQWMEVAIGVPNFDPKAIPFDGEADQRGLYSIGEDMPSFALVSIGNPHAVIFWDDAEQWQSADIDRIGRHFNDCGLFADGINVGFAHVDARDHLRLRVFERGVGETLACGSGAAAAVGAGCRLGRLNAPAMASLPGGQLRVKWQGEGCSLHLCGDANFDFDGYLPHPEGATSS